MTTPGTPQGAQKGRVVLVTGAARGIGRATAARFGRDGAQVAINHPPGEREHAQETARLVAAGGGTPFLVEADVADPAAVERMAVEIDQGLGPVDVLVNNAGICPFANFYDIDIDLWERVHQVNLRGAFLVAQAITRGMVAAGKGGRVISVSSISAHVGGAQQVHYCPTKAGVSSLMKCLAIVLGPAGITCNAVLPGAIATDINAEDLARPGKRQYFESRIPMGRIGRPEDVAGAIWLLSQPEADYINGAELLVDGGFFVNLQ
ncbi:SDR family oxidoreductase [Micromonospora sp. U56]|uniref:SDR family NAD(P)-dependent oxidoreductase n=1 Tax=Micromonospora sp. U56 TaxID=2824900 RepID=UPI001B3769E2|nr:SDR family oxidoreductase [Micromonospora sp. U56]MBQ0895653.1 SDR family oxidoreductase [Micromonospora sp. U56]